MCGIAGFIKSKKENGLNKKTLMMMLKTLDHRGPDFKDYWIERNVYLGHTRLSIIDISEKGNQPMVSHSGRFVIIFNGEIYNFKDLKLKLEKQKKNINWNGNSDTEVFLECVDFWGLTNALKLARGMFAFSIWDKKTKLLTLKKVGLGYIKIGQQATTLSGGEAQRIKLAKELSKRSTGRTMYILDEPTTGLHQHDIKKLLEILHTFVKLGNTVVVIEHNLDVIKTADYIVDMGPEGGVKGGNIVAEGKPEEVCKVKESYTGQFLKPLLA